MKHPLSTLRAHYASGEKIAALTCYDASFAALLENNGVEILLVGDSLGMVLQGAESTLAVTLEAMIYHTASVVKGAKSALVMADMPFATSQISPQNTFANAAKLMAAGAQMVKLEGGIVMQETISFLVQRGIPVCAHLGLTPQSVNQLGGYRVQGKSENDAELLIREAKSVADAGAAMLVLEAIPAELASEITQQIAIPTIGIGAGADCSGQVLVLHDMLGIYPGKKARFVKDFMQGENSIADAIARYVREVKAGRFPTQEHSF
jgi:3-methyl-2-oxobutanoate hydroxymethyltransferase